MTELEALSLTALLAACAIVFLAGLGHGTIGFGFPMLATPPLALLTDVRSAILLTLIPTVAVNIPSILRGGNWRESIGRHWPLVLYIPIGSVIGTKLLIAVDPAPFKLLLAGMILLYLAQPHLSGDSGALHALKRNRTLGYAGFGLLAGFLAGTVNVMVPLLIIFTMGLGMTPVAMVQLFNLCFLAGKLAQVGTFAEAGMLGNVLTWTTVPLVIAAVGALFIGMRLRERVDATTYRRWLRTALAVIAPLLVVQYLFGF